MRVSSLVESVAARAGPLWGLRGGLRGLTFAAVALVALPESAASQWPAEVEVRVRDRVSGAIVARAQVEIVEAGLSIWATDEGRSVLKGVREGPGRLLVRAYGYAPREVAFVAVNGRRVVVDVLLEPAPLPLDGIWAGVSADHASTTGGIRLSREAIESTVGSSLGDVLATLPGVVVRRDYAGGPERVSVRGSAADAVLVVVDGVPINDPLTGEADLSRISRSALHDVVLYRGGASARFGPRARAGAVVVRTGLTDADLGLNLVGGSLGTRRAAVVGSHRRAAVQLSAGAEAARSTGAFAYQLPAATGGGRRSRDNADFQRAGGWAGVDWGTLSVRSSADWTDRGLPGAGYNPSRSARQRDRGARVSAAAEWQAIGLRLRSTGFAATRSNRFRDPAPPAGPAYDTRAAVGDVGVGLQGVVNRTGLGTIEVGLDGRSLRVDASELHVDAPGSALSGGAYAGFSVQPGIGSLRLAARARVDRDGWSGRWHPTHAITAGVSHAGVTVELSHRSAFSPPTLADQFFTEGVAVRPNPALRPERTPGEVELELRYGGGTWSAGASLYAGDVRDLIVWQPDFRFVWSPSNTDVRRGGAELWTEARGRALPWKLTATYAHARVRYDRPGARDTVQVAYRPRNTATAGASWSGSTWTAALSGQYVGQRFPVPAPINPLPGFWSWHAQVGRRGVLAGWEVEAGLRVGRLFDQRHTLIFDFPHPGRTIELLLGVSPGRAERPF